MFGIIKNHTKEDIRLAALCRVLGNPSRVALVKRIARENACIREEFFGSEMLVPRTVALHVIALKREGIVRGSISRRNTSYCIDMGVLEEFKVLFDQLYEEAKRHKENLPLNEKCK